MGPPKWRPMFQSRDPGGDRDAWRSKKMHGIPACRFAVKYDIGRAEMLVYLLRSLCEG